MDAALRYPWIRAHDGDPVGRLRGRRPRRAALPDEAARPSHTRFSLVTPTGTVNFAIADAQKLQHVVCGLRHLARRPVERRAFLWQRAAAINRDKIAAASFEKRLDGLTAFLLKERSALP